MTLRFIYAVKLEDSVCIFMLYRGPWLSKILTSVKMFVANSWKAHNCFNFEIPDAAIYGYRKFSGTFYFTCRQNDSPHVLYLQLPDVSQRGRTCNLQLHPLQVLTRTVIQPSYLLSTKSETRYNYLFYDTTHTDEPTANIKNNGRLNCTQEMIVHLSTHVLSCSDFIAPAL